MINHKIIIFLLPYLIFPEYFHLNYVLVASKTVEVKLNLRAIANKTRKKQMLMSSINLMCSTETLINEFDGYVFGVHLSFAFSMPSCVAI